MTRFALSALAAVLMTSSAWAGPVNDFESKLRESYAQYRIVLFQTNGGKPEAALKAADAFLASWQSLSGTYRAAPPPQYQDDGAWPETLDKVADVGAKAKDDIVKGELPEAHEKLEHVRELIGDLHHRNGIVSFSDRMNAYHGIMERMIKTGQADLKGEAVASLHEDAAVLVYLAVEALKHPPPEALDNAEFQTLSAAFLSSAEAVLAVARGSDTPALKAAIGQLKPAYSKLFLKFG